MTNDHCLKGFWPPEAKVEVDLGIGYTPPLRDPGLVDEIIAVKTDDAKVVTLMVDSGLI
jgi:hypothetical protein